MQGKVRDNFIQLGAPVMQRLERAGYEAFLVGGCVREALRGELRQEFVRAEELTETSAEDTASTDFEKIPICKGEVGFRSASKTLSPSTDIDVTTNALPEEICQVFSDLTVIETGIQHGTVTVLVPVADEVAQRIPIEITTYRVDGNYSDGRHPDQVRFVSSLTEDLRRRDFTVNAMAMDLRGELIDPFGGRADLEAGVIRAVGDPQTRFHEDGLRILRALRFAAVLTTNTELCAVSGDSESNGAKKDVIDRSVPRQGDSIDMTPGTIGTRGFRIDPATEAALFDCAHLLEGISAERILVELKKLVCGPAAGDVVRRYTDILAVVIPELLPMKGFVQHNPYHKYEVLEHCIRAMEAVRAVAPLETPSDRISVDDNGAASAVPANDNNTATEVLPDTAPIAPPQLAYMKLTALLHDIGKPSTYTVDENGIGHFYGHPQAGAEIVRQILRRLKADRFTTDRITTLVRYHDLVYQEDDRLLKRWMNRYTPEVLLEILEIKRADNIATGNVSEELLAKFARIEARIRDIHRDAKAGQTCFCMKDLAVDGKDLLGMGLDEGPEIGATLNHLLESVINDDLPNEKKALLDEVWRLFSHNPGV